MKILKIQHWDDETIRILLEDDETGIYTEIALVNHDEHGWDGMTAVVDAVKTLARDLGVKIVEE